MPEASVADEQIVLDERDGIAVLTLNRPAVLNALSNDLLGALVAELERLDAIPATRVIIVTGGARVFAAGADLNQLAGAALRK
jgi:enoyl-CoA hydratase